MLLFKAFYLPLIKINFIDYLLSLLKPMNNKLSR